MKHCSNPSCKQQNPQKLINFSKHKTGLNGLRPRCKHCCSIESLSLSTLERNKRRYQERKTRPISKDQAKGNRLQQYWPGSTWQAALAYFNILLKQQKHKCAICKGVNKSKDLGVDHDHITGKVRGLLCHQCNAALGHFKDDPYLLQEARSYILTNYTGGFVHA